MSITGQMAVQNNGKGCDVMGRGTTNRPTRVYLIEAIKAATDLRYGNNVIDRLKASKSDAEIEQIMRNARYGLK